MKDHERTDSARHHSDVRGDGPERGDRRAVPHRDPGTDRDSVSDSWGRAAAYDAYADGLHTYALGGLRNHEAAAAAVYCTFLAADHHVAHLGDAEILRPWLYAITRHYCRLGKLPRLRLAPVSKAPDRDGAMAGLERTLLAAELASLDWADTDGLISAHREVLELAVRHGLESRAVGLILSRPAAESFELLSAAWHELERSLAANALLRTTREHCPDLAAFAEGWSGRLTLQRREPLCAHVDTCSRCQYHLHKVVGSPKAPTILSHVAAPKALREKVLGDLLDTSPEKAAEKAAIAARLVRFDRHGFPAVALPRPAVPAGAAGTPGPSRTSAARARPVAAGAPAIAGAAALARTAPPRKARSLGALLAGRVSSPAAEATASAVADAGSRFGLGRGDGARAGSAVGPGARRAAAGAAMLVGSASEAGSRRGAGSLSSAYGAPLPTSAPIPGGEVSTPTGRYIVHTSSSGSSLGSGSYQDIGAQAPTRSRSRSAASSPRRRKATLRSALTSSAVLSGVGTAGVTAFVMFVPSSSAGNKALLTHDHGGVSQSPDVPLPSAGGGVDGGSVPVAGKAAGGASAAGSVIAEARGGAQIVAAVVTSSAAQGGSPPVADSVYVFPPAFGGNSGGPVPLPSASTSAPSPQGVLNVSVNQRSNNPGEATVTLWNSGNAPVAWTATPDARFLTMSATSGVVPAGGQQTVLITVDQRTVPSSAWQAHVRFDPSGATVTLSGSGSGPSTPPPTTPPPTTPPSSTPSTPPTSPPTTPSGTPSSPPTPPPSSPPRSTPSTTPSTKPSSTPSGTPSTSQTSPTPPTHPPSTPPYSTPPSRTRPPTTPPTKPSPPGTQPGPTTAPVHSRPQL